MLAIGALALVAGCWRDGPAAPRRAPATPPRAALPAPLASVIGVVDDAGALQPAVEVPLIGGASFGWRLELGCTDEVQVHEELRLPAPGDWGPDADLEIGADGRTATVRGPLPCADGWIARTWTLSPGDPPGPWELRVTARGFARHVFRVTMVRPPAP